MYLIRQRVLIRPGCFSSNFNTDWEVGGSNPSESVSEDSFFYVCLHNGGLESLLRY